MDKPKSVWLFLDSLRTIILQRNQYFKFAVYKLLHYPPSLLQKPNHSCNSDSLVGISPIASTTISPNIQTPPFGIINWLTNKLGTTKFFVIESSRASTLTSLYKQNSGSILSICAEVWHWKRSFLRILQIKFSVQSKINSKTPNLNRPPLISEFTQISNHHYFGHHVYGQSIHPFNEMGTGSRVHF